MHRGVVQVTPRGRSLLKVLIDTPYIFIKSEVDDMTPEEARDIWSHIKPFFVGVCARASASKVGQQWNMLVRKMSLIERKAKEDAI